MRSSVWCIEMRGLAVVICGALFVPGHLAALPWSKDMVDQPSVKAQEHLVSEPDDSVPREGGEQVPTPADVSEVVLYRLAAARDLDNPVPATDASHERGKAVYETHCQVCHGAGGKGDGPVGQKIVPPPMDLTTPYVQQQPDGQIFYTITHGGVVMPFYRDAIDVDDRWHLVNYLKEAFAAP